jgi:hypothetical protein
MIITKTSKTINMLNNILFSIVNYFRVNIDMLIILINGLTLL